MKNLLPISGGIKQKHLPCHCQSVRFSNGWISSLHEEHITDETLCSGGWCWCEKLTLKPVTSNGIDVGLQTQDAYNQDFWSPWYWYSLTCSSLRTPFKGSMALPRRPCDRVFESIFNHPAGKPLIFRPNAVVTLPDSCNKSTDISHESWERFPFHRFFWLILIQIRICVETYPPGPSSSRHRPEISYF